VSQGESGSEDVDDDDDDNKESMDEIADLPS
jgi:hypothetical protein